MSDRPKHPATEQCRSCGADVVWFSTPKRKKMPVDEESTQATDAVNQLDLTRHKSHFATCPQADRWRKPR